ncbi:MAG: helix-turn-helix domain-containing protein [Streptosporangiales bacterium]
MTTTQTSRPGRRWFTVMDGHRLRRLRRQRGLSQEQLAGRAGISPATVARLDASTTLPAAAAPSAASPAPWAKTLHASPPPRSPDPPLRCCAHPAMTRQSRLPSSRLSGPAAARARAGSRWLRPPGTTLAGRTGPRYRLARAAGVSQTSGISWT